MVIVERDALLPALTLAERVTPAKNPVAIVQHVLLSVSGRAFTVVGTSLDCEVETTGAVAEADGDMAITTPAKPLLDLVRLAPAGSQITLRLDSERLSVQIGRARYRLPTMHPGAFPRLEPGAAGEPPVTVALAGAELADMLGAVAWAQGSERTTAYRLCGIHLRRMTVGDAAYCVTEAMTTVVMARHTAEWPAEAAEPPPVVIPREIIPHIMRIASDAAQITLEIAANLLRLRAGSVALTTRLLDGGPSGFIYIDPTIGALVPARQIVCERAELTAAIGRIATVLAELEDGKRAMQIDFSAAAMITLSAGDHLAGGEGLEEIAAEVEILDETIATDVYKTAKFRPSQMEAALASLDTQTVRITLFEPGRPIRIASAGSAGALDFAMISPMLR